MSELKRFDIVGKYADEEVMYEFRPDGECYDADEVDIVIAMSKEKLVEQTTLRVCAELQLRHQKYKRCLAMAEMCMFKSRISYFEKKINKTRLMSKWRNRWFELAETFKEGK